VNVRARDVDGPVQTRCVLTSTASSDNLADRVEAAVRAYILPKMPPNSSSSCLPSLSGVSLRSTARGVADTSLPVLARSNTLIDVSRFAD
jgi:hypothetical protein